MMILLNLGTKLLDPNPQPSTSAHPDIQIWKMIWGANIPQKIKHFLRRVCHNVLPLKENLFKSKLVNSPPCPIGNAHCETVEHALLLCPWTKAVWFGSFK